MPTELTSNIEINTAEKEVPSLLRIHLEDATTDKGILGMDYPAGVVLGD